MHSQIRLQSTLQVAVVDSALLFTFPQTLIHWLLSIKGNYNTNFHIVYICQYLLIATGYWHRQAHTVGPCVEGRKADLSSATWF